VPCQIQGASKTPDGSWNLKNSVPAMRRSRTYSHHVQWWLEFSLAGPLVSAIRTAAVELLVRTDTQRCFRQQFPAVVLPSRNTLLMWVSKCRQEGSVKNSKPQGRPFSATTRGNVERVRDAMFANSALVNSVASSYIALTRKQRSPNSSQGFALPSIWKQSFSGTYWTGQGETTRFCNLDLVERE